MLWIRPDAGGNLYTVSIDTAGVEDFLALSLDSDISKLRFKFTRGDNELENQSAGTVNMENEWHHIVLAL